MKMTDDRPLFILAGNGPYQNRGCEAIVRGTVEILRRCYDNPRFVCISHFQDDEQYRQQRLDEIDETIAHLHSYRLSIREIIQNFWKPFHLGYAIDYFLRPEALKYRIYKQMLPYLNEAAAVLSIGGDNYSLDYGVPTLFTDLDDVVIHKGRPMIIWGASVGPFSAKPDYERYMSKHLREVTGIFARESVTIDYLKSIDVTENVYPVSDPALLMEPIKPEGIEDEIPIDEEAIGLNLSPLMAKYVTGGDLDAWTKMAASIIDSVAQTADMPVYLIPHVTSPHSDDYTFMQKALSLTEHANRDIVLVSPKYDAAEIKWIISKMILFAGARTHSTIASLSSGVPTLSFAYSIKAQGINRDIFGHTEYCIDPGELSAEVVSDKIDHMLDESTAVRKELMKEMPRAQEAALSAGTELKRLIEVNLYD